MKTLPNPPDTFLGISILWKLTVDWDGDLAQMFETFLENLTCTKTHLPKRKGSLPIFSWIYIQHLVLGGVN